jgi:hypothetical protein
MPESGAKVFGFHVVGQGRGRLVAWCTCGWRSAPVVTAGLAGSSWDTHVLATHASAPGAAPPSDVPSDLGAGRPEGGGGPGQP